MKWDDSQPAQIAFQNANAGQTGVVFKQSGATATAIYKAHLGSSSASALASNSQRKIVRDSNNWYHMVYASGGSIWYSRSTNGGATWTPELQLDSLYQPSEGTFNHLPCIAYIPGTGSVNGTVMVVWVVYVEGDPSRGVSYCELNLSGQIIRREEISFGFSGTAGSDMNVGIGVGRTGNHINTPYKYYPIVVWYDPGYTSSLRARARWEGEWSLEVGLGVLTDVSQFSVAPFCYRGYLNAEWDIAYVANNTLYYAPISMGGPGAPTLGTPQQIAAGGTTRDVRTPSIYVVGGNVDPVNGEPTVTWEQTQPNSAIGFSKRTNGVWDRPAYFSHAGHAATNPVAGENYDAASGNFYIDLLWQCGNHIARVSRSVQTPMWTPIVDVGSGGTPTMSAMLLPTAAPLRAYTTASGQLYAINTGTLVVPQYEQWVANWNIAAISVRVPDYHPTAVFPEAMPYVYKSECEGYVQIPPTALCDSNRGFWIKQPLTQQTWPITYTGTFIDTMAMPVRNCWNMIGSISVPVDTSAVRYSPAGIRGSLFYRYTYGVGYTVVSELNPGIGYWVKSNQNGYMIVQSSPSSSGGLSVEPPKDKFIITDNTGASQELLVVNAEAGQNAMSLEMPPAPPDFDARWEGGEYQTALTPTGEPIELLIAINEAAFPITLAWELNPETGLEYVLPQGGGLNKGSSSISGHSSVSIISPTHKVVLIANQKGKAKPKDVPAVLALHQNYPNPFNPTTEMCFDLPEAGNVSLVVYDVLGREVATLASGYREAGYHSATWNANGQASGVYFARFNVTSADGKNIYAKINKLVLMK